MVSFCDFKFMARKRRALNLYWMSIPSLILEEAPLLFFLRDLVRETMLCPPRPPPSSETAAS